MGDEEVDVPRHIPAGMLTRKLLAVLGISRRPPDCALRQLGFSRIEFSNGRGVTAVTLHLAAAGTGVAGVNPRADNFAALQLRAGDREPELSVFDTAQGRIDAKRIVDPGSLDDPHSVASQIVKSAPGLLKLGSRLAGDPAVGSVIAAALPKAIPISRRKLGKAADHTIRVATLHNEIGAETKCFVRQGRKDRRFDPDSRLLGASAADQWQHVHDVLDRVRVDLYEALHAFNTEHEAAGRPRSSRAVVNLGVTAAWERLARRSVEAAADDRMWPLAVYLLGFHDGPAQYVRRVGSGLEP